MGWSDVALCLSGPVVQDLRTHFTQRWNFIYDEKYSKKATRYSRLPDTHSGAQEQPSQQRGFEGEEGEGERGLFGHGGLRQKMYSKFEQHGQYGQDQSSHQEQQYSHQEHGSQRGSVDCQITRSSAKWSHNLVSTEVSKSIH